MWALLGFLWVERLFHENLSKIIYLAVLYLYAGLCIFPVLFQNVRLKILHASSSTQLVFVCLGISLFFIRIGIKIGIKW